MEKTRAEVKYYLVAVVSVAIALILTLTIEHLVARSLVAPFLAAVAITSWYGGMRPGIVAVVLSIVACHYYIFPPIDSIATGTPASLVRNAQFVLVASSICYLTGRLRFTTQRLTRTNQTLESEIQERIKAEAELRALFLAIPDPLFVIDAAGRILRVALGESEKLYTPINEQVNRTLHEIFDRPQADTYLNYIQQALQTQQSVAVEYNLMLGEQETWFAARIAPISADFVIWLARDISEQRNAALRERKRAEAASILEERNRMAREIHDTLAQSFTGILVHMGTVSRLATTNPAAIQTHVDTVRDLARSGLAEARRSVAALRPQLLEDGNLWTALERFVSSLQSSTEARLTCQIVGIPYLLPSETENHLLRIGQEAVTNAVKYAHANEILVELVYEPTSCCLRVQDNGRGFAIGTTILNKGFGLLGMTERAEHIGAQISIESQPGQGTEVVVTVKREAAV
jgi:signal transduction histidine kinase